MPALGDPPPQGHWEQKNAHGAPVAVSYVPPNAKVGSTLSLARRGRTAGRRAQEMRPCHLRIGAVPNAAGSAYIEQGKTKIIATVYGPRQIERFSNTGGEGVLAVDLQFAPFCGAGGGAVEASDKRSTLYSSMLLRALESIVLLDRYTKTMFDISLVVLEDDGAVLTAALSAASLALADANVEMKDLAAGATVHVVPDTADGKSFLLLDCDGEEERLLPEGSAVVHFGLCQSRGSLCMMHSAGPLPAAQLERMILLARDSAEAVGAEVRKCLEKRVEKRSAKRLKLAAAAGADSGGGGGYPQMEEG